MERETIAERIRDNMHELAKTGRWLGGTTPTGYSSESVQKVTTDGKAKKACKLKLIPEEAEIIKLIFDLYIEYDSLTAPESELMKLGIKTKNNKHFTRFSIKSILQNPVYMTADETAYNYLVKENTDLNSDKKDFDDIYAIMAYNRTRQEKGKAVTYLPPDKWIVAVCLHPGIIPGKIWISVQDSLNRNKSKAYRKPQNNKALLTGLLYCTCGNRMYPKISKQKTANGKPIYIYVCKLKERSKRTLCNSKNANGNTLDVAVIEQIKLLEDDKGSFIDQLEQSRKFYTRNRVAYEDQIASMQKNKSDIDVMRQLLSVFKDSIDEMTVEQKRSAIRTLVRKVVWDGVKAHIILFGAQDDDIEYPPLSQFSNETNAAEDDDILTKTHRGEDIKRDFTVNRLI